MCLSELCFNEKIFCFINDWFLFQIVWFLFVIIVIIDEIQISYWYLNYKIIKNFYLLLQRI